MSGLRSRALVLGTLALAIVVGLILDELNALAPLEGILLQATLPVQRLLSRLTQTVITSGNKVSLLASARKLEELEARNKQLESLVDQLMIENVRLKEVEAQNEDLRDKLNFSETHPEYIIKAAQVRGRVTGTEPNNLLQTLIVDVGRRHGIAKGMPVVSERGLVGHVQGVGTNWSRVLLIVDPSSSVTAMTQSERAPGVVSGRLEQDMALEYVPQEETLVVGDVVLTSGMGGRYPHGLVIGQITEVHQQDIEAFQHATVRPSVNFRKLESVLVITSFEPLDVGGALDTAPESASVELTPETTRTP